MKQKGGEKEVDCTFSTLSGFGGVGGPPVSKLELEEKSQCEKLLVCVELMYPSYKSTLWGHASCFPSVYFT